jgi:hypothetical protein
MECWAGWGAQGHQKAHARGMLRPVGFLSAPYGPHLGSTQCIVSSICFVDFTLVPNQTLPWPRIELVCASAGMLKMDSPWMLAGQGVCVGTAGGDGL